MSDSGTRSFAFFDVDDTLIAVKSMFSFQEFWYAQTTDPQQQALFTEEMRRLRCENAPWELLNRRYYAYFAGRTVAKVEQLAARWFANLEASTPNLYHDAIVARLNAHQRDGIEPVFVSGSFPALLAPVAARLSVRHILATTMETADGVFTGNILPPQTIGVGKADAVVAFLKSHDCDGRHCYAYGDDISDLPMLNTIGNPVVVSGGRGLEAHAHTVGWPILAPYLATTSIQSHA